MNPPIIPVKPVRKTRMRHKRRAAPPKKGRAVHALKPHVDAHPRKT